MVVSLAKKNKFIFVINRSKKNKSEGLSFTIIFTVSDK